jgi:hypothetical protein
MSAARLVGLVLLIVGVILLVFGINATHSVGERAVETVTGKYTSNTMWYIVGGIASIIAGGGMIFFGRPTHA